MDLNFRCDCPITSAIDVLGDRWILVLIKQMLLENRHTFKDFTESDEAIATNILSSKLKILEELKFISKTKLPNNKKTNIYILTEQGLALAPVIVELALWSDQFIRPLNPIMRSDKELEMMKTDRAGFIKILIEQYKANLPETI